MGNRYVKMESSDWETIVSSLKSEHDRLTSEIVSRETENKIIRKQFDIHQRALMSMVLILAVVLGCADFAFIESFHAAFYIFPIVVVEVLVIALWVIVAENKAVAVVKLLYKDYLSVFLFVLAFTILLFAILKLMAYHWL